MKILEKTVVSISVVNTFITFIIGENVNRFENEVNLTLQWLLLLCVI